MAESRENLPSPEPRRDPARLAAVRATGLLDSDIEEVFDRLTRLAVKLLRIPASFISLVDEDRDFYKSACGFGEPLASARELTGPTFCHYTIRQSTPLVIPDTAADPMYRDVPTVRTLGVAAYVGVPLITQGEVIGAFCAIDVQPHPWSVDEVEVLIELAASAQREIDLRAAIAVATAASATAEAQRAELEQSNRQLAAQAVVLEAQAEELRASTAHLEERTEYAESANRSKGDFLSSMSHELRTPLNAIDGYADLISLGVRGPVTEEQEDYLARIRRASKHLHVLITEILEFSRVDGGHTTYDIRDVRAPEVISSAIELLAPQIAEAGLMLHYDRGGAEVRCGERDVRADENRLRQILVNLLTNAMKFTPTNGSVTVTCDCRDHRIRIAVADTGRGIPHDQLQAVFEPFVQLERDRTVVRHQGVGLGLAICRLLARGMNGDLSVESQVGAGSTFTLVLPAA